MESEAVPPQPSQPEHSAAPAEQDSALPLADKQGSGTLSMAFANDLFVSSDGNFSNGLSFIWTSNEVGTFDPEGFMNNYVDFWSFLPVVGNEGTRNFLTFGIGQAISTPTDIDLPNPPLTEQPYAGLLAGTTMVHTETESSLHTWALLLGIVGPSSGAEQAQKAIHELTGSDPPEGWDHQIKDEPVINTYYDWRHRLSRKAESRGWDGDVLSSAGGGLGNAWTGAWCSLVGRWGYNLPQNFGPGMPRTGLGGAPFQIQPRVKPWQVYGFLGLDGQWVGRNIFLDGNNWKDSRSVESEPWVAGYMAGFGVQKGRFALTFAHYNLTDTYETQTENNSFGTMTLSWRF